MKGQKRETTFEIADQSLQSGRYFLDLHDFSEI